jgi:hypothetical protein
MTEKPAVLESSRVEHAGPRVLSLHPTGSCDQECDPCYIRGRAFERERDPEFFADLVRHAREVDGLREVALSVNIDPEGSRRNRQALDLITRAVTNTGLRLSVTTNYENVKAWGAAAFSTCHLVSLSVDEYKFPRLKLPEDFFDQVTNLQAEGCVVSLNVLLSKHMLEHLTLPRLRGWLSSADQVFLLIPKHYDLDFSRAELHAFFDGISAIWEEPDRFFHLQVDSCIRPQVFPWNQLAPTCGWASNLVHILPDGGMALCTMDDPLLKLERPDEIAGAVRRFYVEHQQAGRSCCPYMAFAGN